MHTQRFWTLNKLVVLLAIIAFALLLLEIRYDHRHVLGEKPVSWTPLVYSGLMILAGILGLIFWRRGGRQALMFGFSLGMVVGTLGWWFHNQKHPVQDVRMELSAWLQPVGDNQDSSTAQGHAPGPMAPIMAPLSFAGLGLLGLLACMPQLQQQGANTGVKSAEEEQTEDEKVTS